MEMKISADEAKLALDDVEDLRSIKKLELTQTVKNTYK